VAHQSIQEAVVAQAAATLAAGALRCVDATEMPEAAKLSDYALDVFWRIYESMRGGVEIPSLDVPSVPGAPTVLEPASL
jgi:hypothetical protein